ncbi:unnamed protein product [Rotaria magnacalcarata]|uniref:HAT C-terminal dimerisation domain-containing protein n=1 Tax=Rotaria magnacalcarata TaxID=392030 RepID=A0A8S2K1X4_9BILA|nr:unnamed protein product [Rotaria magnacalcarata]
MHSTNTLDEIFDVPDKEDNIPQQPLDRTEFDRYLGDETRIDNNTNILTYWHLNKSIYPNLARLAKRILAIPATNTTIERLFSDSANTKTDRRTRLDTDKINNLKRNHSLTSTDSTPTATPNKKIKLIAGSPELYDETADESDDDEQF